MARIHHQEADAMPITIQSLARKNRRELGRLEERLGHSFHEPVHLQKAMIHSSYGFEQGLGPGVNNETLEFLGDAVLDLTVGFALFRRYPHLREGSLTQLRSALVNEQHLARMAREIELGSHLLLGKGEEASSGREKPSILACAYEALAGAIFLDGGYGAASAFVERHFLPLLDEQGLGARAWADAKSGLQEALQDRFGEGPEYLLEGEEGPDHEKIFHVAVRFRQEILGRGSARSKKQAEQEAAAVALKNLAAGDPAGRS